MPKQASKISIYIVSDSIGETGENIVRAALAQFDVGDVHTKKTPYVHTKNQLKDIIDQASLEDEVILFHTIVDRELIEFTSNYSKEKGIRSVDLMSPTVRAIENRTGLEPSREPGIVRKMDETYFKRVEAVEFAVKYDDGQDSAGILEADLVILGISRTSKTPLSMFLANKNIKVCNIPLVPESKPPKEIFQIPARRVVGLTNSPMEVSEIREARLIALGLPKGSNYARMERILEELDYADEIMKKIGCPVVDMTNKAIEDTAEIILSILKKYNSRFEYI